MLKKAASGLFIVLLATALPLPAASSDNVAYNLPWEKFSFRAGYFFAGMNDQVTVGAGGGVSTARALQASPVSAP